MVAWLFIIWTCLILTIKKSINQFGVPRYLWISTFFAFRKKICLQYLLWWSKRGLKCALFITVLAKRCCSWIFLSLNILSILDKPKKFLNRYTLYTRIWLQGYLTYFLAVFFLSKFYLILTHILLKWIQIFLAVFSLNILYDFNLTHI